MTSCRVSYNSTQCIKYVTADHKNDKSSVTYFILSCGMNDYHTDLMDKYVNGVAAVAVYTHICDIRAL
jgi:acid phosphatase family membrane protein YuiD